MPKVHPVKVALASRGQTQRACAEAIGISSPLLGRVLNKQSAPWPALRRKLSEHLGMPESELFPECAE